MHDPRVFETVDAVVLTDISSSFQSWHRASANLPESFRNGALQASTENDREFHYFRV